MYFWCKSWVSWKFDFRLIYSLDSSNLVIPDEGLIWSMSEHATCHLWHFLHLCHLACTMINDSTFYSLQVSIYITAKFCSWSQKCPVVPGSNVPNKIFFKWDDLSNSVVQTQYKPILLAWSAILFSFEDIICVKQWVTSSGFA